MRTIAVINQKGGSAKTTTSVCLGATLAERGKKVLLIDLDPQYSATTWMATHAVGRGVFDLFDGPQKTTLRSLIHPTATPGFSLVGSSAWLVGVEKALSKKSGVETVLREKLADLDDPFDYVLIDCPPALGVLTVNALTAVREVLVPVACQVMSLQGLAQLIQTVEMVRERLNPQVRISGIVACRLDNRTKHGPEIVGMLRTRFPEMMTTAIRENIRLAECPSMGEPITSYASGSSGAKEYRSLALELINQEERESHEQIANG